MVMCRPLERDAFAHYLMISVEKNDRKLFVAWTDRTSFFCDLLKSLFYEPFAKCHILCSIGVVNDDVTIVK